MSSEKISFLIDNLAESLEVEVKNWLGGLGTNDERAKLAKELIALANHGGGYVFVGFEDEGDGHPEVTPDEGELEAFTQDNIASVVERYVTPPCQCTVSFHKRAGSEAQHPVITVPGNHRTPIWAKAGSPDNTTLKNGTVYVRRPGGQSEPARTQDDWERLLERLVKARQSEQLSAIREIMNPSSVIVEEVRPELNDWMEESYAAWHRRIDPLQESDARRLSEGHWSVAFKIEPFNRPSLRELRDSLEREMPAYSGWRPFTFIHRDPLRPVASGDVIEAWLAEEHAPDTLVTASDHADFWRVSRDGTGFLLRPMQEDRPGYLSNRTPRPEGKFFDWTLPIYRLAEVLKFIEAFALKFADSDAQYSLVLTYEGTNGRSLQQHSLRYNLWDHGVCTQDKLETRTSGPVSEIGLALEEKIFTLLTPIYEQFDFTELPKVLVDNVVREALSYR